MKRTEPDQFRGGSAQQSRGRGGSGAIASVQLFTTAMFTSAFLLFAVQPLFAKMTLPLLGGAPNVWNAAMVFFQGALLLGYLYAHLLTRHVAPRFQLILHAIVLSAGLVFLPIAIPQGWTPPTTGSQGLWLIGMFTVAIGAPFFALSANAPLLQRWFSYTDHKSAADPYFLYAASNLGSMLSLLSYPLVFEPMLGLRTQSAIWSFGYIGLLALVVIAGFWSLRTPVASVHKDEPPVPRQSGWSQRLWWLAFAFAPSALMLAVTTHLTTNIAPAPFLWVAPLSLYLLSFVIAFGGAGALVHRVVRRAAPTALIVFSIISVVTARDAFGVHNIFDNELVSITTAVASFFLVALACHGELAARRPPPEKLTEFYLIMSLGGVLGGIFVALVAPVIFDTIAEYPLLIVFAAFLIGSIALSRKDARPSGVFTGAQKLALIALLVLIAISAMSKVTGDLLPHIPLLVVTTLSAIGAALAALRLRTSGVGFALAIAAVIFCFTGMREAASPDLAQTIARDRSFFGPWRVRSFQLEDFTAHTFVHGTTLHNLQLRRTVEEEMTPYASYSKVGVFGQALDALRKRDGTPRVGVIGLGAGALACHANTGEDWTFYEIDPTIIELAQTPQYFSFLNRCRPDAKIVRGDARLSISAEVARDQPRFDILIIDAFSSDSIPAHLITREALALYRQRVAPNGLILFHTTNRYLDVSSIAIRLAEDGGLDWRYQHHAPRAAENSRGLISPTNAVIVANAATSTSLFLNDLAWSKPPAHPRVPVWTDDYTNVLSALIAHRDNEPDEDVKTNLSFDRR